MGIIRHNNRHNNSPVIHVASIDVGRLWDTYIVTVHMDGKESTLYLNSDAWEAMQRGIGQTPILSASQKRLLLT